MMLKIRALLKAFSSAAPFVKPVHAGFFSPAVVFVSAATILLYVFGCIDDPVMPQKTFCQLDIAATQGGSVSWTPQMDSIAAGTILKVTAWPEEGFYFAGYEGSVQDIQNPLSFPLQSDVQLTAVFKPFPRGLVQINAKDASFTMGSDDSRADAFERPAHTVTFTYNYAVAPTEVTQQEYESVMGADALEKLLARGDYGRHDSLPVYNITWYEAVLFCNAKSRMDGLDTVYSYDAVCQVIGECPYTLENLQIHYDRAGYRLPTEAEWEYALKSVNASDYVWNADSADRHAWYSLTTQGGPEKVARLLPTVNGLFDMAGNVSEWVNDWLGAYPDTATTNPVGPDHLPLEQFEATWQRPVRGGSWNLGDYYLRTTTRTGPYEVPATTASQAIGFRIALGPFERMQQNDSEKEKGKDSNAVTLLTKKSDLFNFLGTAECKLVFTTESLDDNRLLTIDFSDYELTTRHIRVESSVKRADISPDGEWIAYGTQYPGYSQGSHIGVIGYTDTAATPDITMLDNAFLPYWWIDTTGTDMALVYTTGASKNNDERWRSEQTIQHRFSNGSFGTKTVLTESGSYHGGLSADGRFVATGYPRAYLWDRRVGHRFSMFVPPYNGFDDTVQVCNISINPGKKHPDRVMLLDFGAGQSKNTVVGERYGLHEYIFVVRTDLHTDHVVDYYRAPEGYAQWQDTRYTNHPDFGIGIAGTGSNTTIFLVNLKTKEYLPIASGENLRWPGFWIDPRELPETEDPNYAFAQYNIPNTSAGGQTNITKKLKLFWKQRETYEVAVVGSSPEYYGIHTNLFSFPAINLATSNSDQLTSYLTIRHYILPHAPQLKAMVIGLDPGFLSRDTHPDDPWLVGLYDSRGYNFDKDNNFWSDGLPSAIQNKIDLYTPEDWEGFDSTGTYLTDITGVWGEPVIDQTGHAFEDSIVQMNLGFLRAAVDSCLQHDVAVLLVNAPQHPDYRQTGVMGRYGPRWEEYEKLDSLMREWDNQSPLVRFYDAHDYGNHDYTEDEAFDANHLNSKGARKLSPRLDSILLDMGLSQ